MNRFKKLIHTAQAQALLLIARVLPIATAVMVCALMLAPLFARADGPSGPSGISGPAAVPPITPSTLPDLSTSDGVTALIGLVHTAIVHKQWGLVAALGVTVLVWALRKYVPKESSVGRFVSSKVGGIGSTFLLTGSGAIATALLGGQPLTAAVWIQVVTVAVTASGGWAIFKNLSEAWTEYKAGETGVKASATPSDEKKTLNG